MSIDSIVAKFQHIFSKNNTPPNLRLGREAVISLVIHACFQFGASMSGLFLNLYLWRLTENFTVNALYNLINFGITPFAFALAGFIAKKLDRMVVYRLGIVFNAVFYLLVIIAGENVPNYFVLFAIINGIASGFYWTGFLIVQYDVSTDRNRIRYLAINMISFNLAGLAGPAIAGIVIQRMDGLSGYLIIFTLAFIMFVIAAVISTKIAATVNEKRTYYLKYVGLLMRKNKNWAKGAISFLFVGLFQGIMLFLPNILLFRALGREDWVGYFGVFFSALTVLTGYVISRKAEKDRVRQYIFWATLGVVFGSLFLLYEVTLWTVAIFMILFSISNPLMMNSVTSYFYRLIGTLPLKGQLRVESVVVREVFVNIGRVVSIAILVVLASDLNSIWLPIVLTTMAAAQFFMLLLIKRGEEEGDAAPVVKVEVSDSARKQSSNV